MSESNVSTDPLIRIRDLQKAYGDLKVLRGIDLDIAAGETVAIIGPSGSGKSTLLRLLMTLEKPDAGAIEIDGTSMWTVQRNGRTEPAPESHLRKVRGKIGMVFQHFNLFPHMTALQNIASAPHLVLGMAKPDAQEHASRFLQMVGLEEKADEYPARLSGGQQQRVAIARALAMQPRAMLFDEVTSALDPELVEEVLGVLRRLAEESDMAKVIVTHEMRFARDSADRIVFFDGGLILEEGPPEKIFTAPEHDRTREFLQTILEH